MIDCPHCSHRAGAELAGNPPSPGGPVTALEREMVRASRQLLGHALMADARFDVSGEHDARAAQALDDLAHATAKVMALEDIATRARLIRAAMRARNRVAPEPQPTYVFDRSEFVTLGLESIAADIIGETPLAEDIAEQVARTYRRYTDTLRGRIAASVVYTVEKQIASLVRDGATVKDFTAWSERLTGGHVSDNFANNLARTERNKAYAAGTVQAAFSPELDDWIIAFRYHAVGDADTRSNHFANKNRMWNKRHPIWRERMPPNGYRCRCTPINVSRAQAKRMGRLRDDGTFIDDEVPANGEPDPGFASSPAFEIYGANP